MVSTSKWPNIFKVMLLMVVVLCVCDCLPSKIRDLLEENESKSLEASDENNKIDIIEEKMNEINKMYEMLNFFRFLKTNNISPDEFMNTYFDDNVVSTFKRSERSLQDTFKYFFFIH